MNKPLDHKAFPFGSATASYLPATVAPAGQTPEGLPVGLPVGLQIVGPGFADPSIIWPTEQLSRPIGGCVAPPGC